MLLHCQFTKALVSHKTPTLSFNICPAYCHRLVGLHFSISQPLSKKKKNSPCRQAIFSTWAWWAFLEILENIMKTAPKSTSLLQIIKSYSSQNSSWSQLAKLVLKEQVPNVFSNRYHSYLRCGECSNRTQFWSPLGPLLCVLPDWSDRFNTSNSCSSIPKAECEIHETGGENKTTV